MKSHYSIYLDESGDLGFNWKEKRPSRYFVITLLVCENQLAEKGIRQAVKRTLKNKINFRKNKKRHVQELKGAHTSLSIKKYFYNQLPKTGWKLYSVVLDKYNHRYDMTKASYKHALYNRLTQFAISKIKFPLNLESVVITVDKCKIGIACHRFNNSVTNQINKAFPSNLSPKVVVDHEHSQNFLMLQAADMFSWGISRKYSENETEWYDSFRDKITFVGRYSEARSVKEIKKVAPAAPYS